jgi:hypothetical protein
VVGVRARAHPQLTYSGFPSSHSKGHFSHSKILHSVCGLWLLGASAGVSEVPSYAVRRYWYCGWLALGVGWCLLCVVD